MDQLAEKLKLSKDRIKKCKAVAYKVHRLVERSMENEPLLGNFFFNDYELSFNPPDFKIIGSCTKNTGIQPKHDIDMTLIFPCDNFYDFQLLLKKKLPDILWTKYKISQELPNGYERNNLCIFVIILEEITTMVENILIKNGFIVNGPILSWRKSFVAQNSREDNFDWNNSGTGLKCEFKNVKIDVSITIEDVDFEFSDWFLKDRVAELIQFPIHTHGKLEDFFLQPLMACIVANSTKGSSQSLSENAINALRILKFWKFLLDNDGKCLENLKSYFKAGFNGLNCAEIVQNYFEYHGF
jgi:hypothetical protein